MSRIIRLCPRKCFQQAARTSVSVSSVISSYGWVPQYVHKVYVMISTLHHTSFVRSDPQIWMGQNSEPKLMKQSWFTIIRVTYSKKSRETSANQHCDVVPSWVPEPMLTDPGLAGLCSMSGSGVAGAPAGGTQVANIFLRRTSTSSTHTSNIIKLSNIIDTIVLSMWFHWGPRPTSDPISSPSGVSSHPNQRHPGPAFWGSGVRRCFGHVQRTWCEDGYPLVNSHITMENHHF